MEFKGTKGKWIVSCYNEPFIFSELNGLEGNVICLPPDNNYPKSKINWKYNSKLISKAPEMLEIIQKLIERLEVLNQGNLILVEEAEKLIKEATTI